MGCEVGIKVLVPPRVEACRAALLSVSVVVTQTPDMQDHGHGASAPRGVPVYLPSFTGIKLYCLVTEAVGCEQLA